MTTIFKYFMFGKYGCLDTNARVCCMHVFLVLAIKFWEISSMEGREEGGGGGGF